MSRRTSPWPLLTIANALDIILSHTEPRDADLIPLSAAAGLVLAEDVLAPEPLPPFPASVKDGYAVISSVRPEISH
jgi:gephyrin